MRNIKKLLIELDKACSEFDYEYSINVGGSCFAASVIAKHLDILNIKYYLVVTDYYDKNVTCVTNEIKNRKVNKLARNSICGNNTCNHYYLYIPKYSIKINYDYSRENTIFIKEITYKDIVWIYKKGDWNNYYNTDNNNKFINLINSICNKYEK